MKKLYLDRTELQDCVGVFVKDAQVINAGTTVNAMSEKHKNGEYQRFAEEYGIHFIFRDAIPQVAFYAVPQLDVFATDGAGGLLATLGEETSARSEAPVCFIGQDGKCYLAAESFKEFVQNAAGWQTRLQPFEGLKCYPSKAEAEKELEFISLKGSAL